MSDNITLVVKDEQTPFILKQTANENVFVLTDKGEGDITLVFGTPSVTGNVNLKGPKGDPGDGANSYTHTQVSPSATWTVNHNLGYKPSAVSVLSAGGQIVLAGILHTSDNQLVVSFSVPYSGIVRII